MKSILGMGNALTDILAVLPDDSLLKQFHLPKGSMQHVDMATGDRIWNTLKNIGVQYVAGGSSANTITCTAIFGMKSGFIGKVGDDELGHLYKSDQEQYGIKSYLLKGTKSSGRAMVFITAPNAERTFAVYLGAALELVTEDLNFTLKVIWFRTRILSAGRSKWRKPQAALFRWTWLRTTWWNRTRLSCMT